VQTFQPGAEPPIRYRFDVSKVISRAFSITWRHRWLWVLGVFGGAGVGGGFNFNVGGKRSKALAQVGQFVAAHPVLLMVLAVTLLLIVVVGFAISCVAVPGSIWAGLQLDAGHEVGLRMAWRQGRARGWRYFRLALLQGLIGLTVLLGFGLFVLAGMVLFSLGHESMIPVLVLGGLVVILALIAALLVLDFGLLWSSRLLVIMELGAVDSIRAGWWLFKYTWGDTVVFSLAFGVAKRAVSLGLVVVVLVVSVPGIVMVAVFFATKAAPLILLVFGALWLLVIGGGVAVVSGGYLGALDQVGYALAARDLALARGMRVRPEVIGYDPALQLSLPG
jgi:hypothetical protein